MNALDSVVALALNGFTRRSGLFDGLLLLFATNALLKSAPLFALYWYEWFRPDGNTDERRRIILTSFLACLIALFVGRALALTLPFRQRPIEDARLDLVRPYGMNVDLSAWSSFPSDHAMFFVVLALGIFVLSRRLGWLALAHVVALVLAPRLFLGLHFLTDIVAGAIIGVGIGVLVLRGSAWHAVARYGLHWSRRHPASFYAAAFIVTWQMATLFDDLRSFGSFTWHVLTRLIMLSND